MSCIIIKTIISSSGVLATFEIEEVLVQSENKISDELIKLISESSTESYPVVIWLEDINNVEASIENEIGFNLTSLEKEYFAPSNDLINELVKAAEGNPTEYLDLLM